MISDEAPAVSNDEVRHAIARIVLAKREKNQAARNNGKRPRLIETAMFNEVWKRIGTDKTHPLTLENQLLRMVRAGTIRQVAGGFVTAMQSVAAARELERRS